MKYFVGRKSAKRLAEKHLIKNVDGTTTHVTIVRHFDAVGRDNKLSELSSEKRMIDSALEIANATVDLL